MKVNARLKPSRYGVADSRSNRASRCIAFLCLAAAACSGSAGIGAVSCGIPGGAPPPAAQHTPIGQLTPIDIDALLAHTKMLSSDAFEGRAPGTKGEDLSVAYLADQFTKLGLKPGNTDGTYMQKVPLVGITPAPAPLVFKKGSLHQTLKWKDDVVAWTKHVASSASLDNSEMIFAGYGVVAPEFDWDDYKGVDVKGKTLVVLVNDPPVPDPANPDELDAKTFGGKAMTYYGRWTYKYEIGAQKGAASVLIVHETGPAGYGFNVVQGKTGEQFDLVTPDKNMGRAAIEGWITLDQAKKLLQSSGQDFEALKKQAVTAEEQGLLGSQYYSVTPVYPLAKTLADINMDSWNVHGRTKDLTLIGYGASDLDDYARDAAGEQGRVVHGDAEPEKGFYYRSDHFNFAKQGVPALNPDSGVDYIGKPTDYARQVRAEWNEKRYHTPLDVVLPDWDLTGTREDLTVLFAVGYRVAQADKFPEWKPGNEFQAKRDAMLKK